MFKIIYFLTIIYMIAAKAANRLNNHLVKGEIVKLCNVTNTFSCYKDNCQLIEEFTIANNYSFDCFDRYLPISYFHGTQEKIGYLPNENRPIISNTQLVSEICILIKR